MAKSPTPAARIAAIKEADAADRAERVDLDKLTLAALVEAANEALPLILRMEAACADLVSDAVEPALKLQGAHTSDRLRNIIVVAEASIATLSPPQEA